MLSVIIPTRDRVTLLASALQSLRGQQLSSECFEVLVIDNNSTDTTAAVTQQFAERMPNLRRFHEPVIGLHAGRHRGLKEASGDILVFADDDTRATPDWLAAIAQNFADPEVVMVGGNNYPDFKAEPPPWLQQLWRRPSLGGHAIPSLSVLSLPEGRREISPYMVWGCNFSIRKSVLVDAGGFHPDAMPQELIRFRGDGETHVSKFVADHNLRCVFDSRASVLHAVTAERMSVEYFKRRAYNQGISDSYTQLRNSRNASKHKTRLERSRLLGRRILDSAYAKLQALKLEAAEIRELQRATREGYEEGFAYHHAVYRQDEKVNAWVHKPNYF